MKAWQKWRHLNWICTSGELNDPIEIKKIETIGLSPNLWALALHVYFLEIVATSWKRKYHLILHVYLGLRGKNQSE
jgi:hypothetical protein